MLLSAYASHVSAVLLSWSGVAAVVACGLVHRHYALDNVRQKSKVAVKEGVHTLATVCRGIIFLMLGHDMFWMAWKVDWNLLGLIVVLSALYRYETSVFVERVLFCSAEN